MTEHRIKVVYLGLRDVPHLRSQIVLPAAILAGVPAAYEVLFESGMELSTGVFDRAWVVGRAARAGDPTDMPAAEADRRAGPPAGSLAQ